MDDFLYADYDVLPEHRPSAYPKTLMEGKTPMWSPLYPMSTDELEMLKAYVEKVVDRILSRIEKKNEIYATYLNHWYLTHFCEMCEAAITIAGGRWLNEWMIRYGWIP